MIPLYFSKLGYRLRLTKAVLPDSVVEDSEACFLIEFTNDGYAAPANQRDVKIILRSRYQYINVTSHNQGKAKDVLFTLQQLIAVKPL